MKIVALIPAAGSGSRYSKDKNKLLENLAEIPVIIKTLQVISSVETISSIIICTSEDLIREITTLTSSYNFSKQINVILGGKTRQESVFKGLNAIDKNTDFVLIHDGARPLITKYIVENSINTAIKNGASVVAVPAKDTIKRVSSDTKQVLETLNRAELWNIQTPQVFNYSQLVEGHTKFAGKNFTDDSGIIETMGIPVTVVMGSYKNIKITTPEDLQIAEIFSSAD